MYNYYSTSLYISSGNALSIQTGVGSIAPLSRIQNLSISIDSPKQTFKFLNLEGLSTQLDPSYVDVSLGYYPTTGLNEKYIGLSLDGTGNAIRSLNQDKNIYVTYLEDNLEFIYYSGIDYSKFKTVSIGNALLKSYNLVARVGDLVSVTCQFEGLNLQVQTGVPVDRQLPSVDQETFYFVSGNYSLPTGYQPMDNSIPALKANDVTVNIPTGSALGLILSGDGVFHLQNFEFNISINRQTIREVGKVIKQRKIVFPIELNFGCSAYIDKYQSDNLNKLICDDVTQDFNVTIKKPCSNENALNLFLRKFKLESQNITQEIGTKNQVDLRWKGYMYNFGTGCSYFSINNI